MRLDKYLKVSRLIKRRSVANEACDKFARRFRGVEEGAGGTPLTELTEPELLDLWQRAKQKES